MAWGRVNKPVHGVPSSTSVVYLSTYLPSIIPVSFPPVRPVHCHCYHQHPGWRPPRKADRRPWPGSIRGTSACVCLSFPAIRANARGRRPAWTPTAVHNPVLKPPLECFRLRSAEGPERICGEGLGALPVDCRFSSPTWLPHTSARGLLLPLHSIFLQGRKLPLSAAPPVRESCTETRGRARSHTAVGVAPAVCSSSLRSDLEKQGARSSVVAPCATHPMHCMRTGPRWAPLHACWSQPESPGCPERKVLTLRSGEQVGRWRPFIYSTRFLSAFRNTAFGERNVGYCLAN